MNSNTKKQIESMPFITEKWSYRLMQFEEYLRAKQPEEYIRRCEKGTGLSFVCNLKEKYYLTLTLIEQDEGIEGAGAIEIARQRVMP